MPQVHRVVPDLYEAITRPIQLAVIKQIIAATSMPEDTFIEFAGQRDGIPTYRDVMGKNSMDPAKFSYFGKVQVTAEDTVDENNVLNRSYNYNDNKTVFLDEENKIAICPVYALHDCRLTFKYRTRDKGDATRWREDMRRRMKLKFTDESFLASYEYGFDNVLIRFLDVFYQMKERVSPDNETFPQWLHRCFKQKPTILTDRAGDSAMVAMKETQYNILGNFDFTTVPPDEAVNEGACYEISFDYKFQYDAPSMLVLHYPLVIHNQLVPKNYRPDHIVYDPFAFGNGQGSLSTSRYYNILSKQCGQYRRDGRGGIIYPYFDDFWPDVEIEHQAPFAQFLISIDQNDLRAILDLTNLGKYKFDPELLDYIKSSGNMVFKRNQRAFTITLYQDGIPIDHNCLELTEDLKIRSTFDLNLRKIYHVRITVATQLFVLPKEAQIALRRNPSFTFKLIDLLDPSIRANGKLPTVLAGKLISESEWIKVIRLLKETYWYYCKDGQKIWPLVLTSFVGVTK